MRKNTFTCKRCRQILPVHGAGVLNYTGGTGYATDRRRRKTCYACCAEVDKAEMRKRGRILLYLSRDGSAYWKITNWPGTLTIYPTRASSSRCWGFGREYPRHDVRFLFEGQRWYGVNQGDNQILRCRRVKA